MKISTKEVFDYSEKFKKRVILEIVENRLGYRAAVRKYWGVDSRRDIDRYRSTVRRWVQCYLGKGEDVLKHTEKTKDIPEESLPDKPPPQTMEELLKENFELRMEVAYLKKLRALVLAKEAAAKKRRQLSRN